MNDTNSQFIDANVEAVKAKMSERANVGFRKYGVTTERKDLSLLDWLRHAQEEAMDMAIYLEAAIRKEEIRPFKWVLTSNLPDGVTSVIQEPEPDSGADASTHGMNGTAPAT